MKMIYTLILIMFTLGTSASAQAVAINDDGTSPDGSAILDVNALNKGLLWPRLTTPQRESITNPAPGLVIFNTETKDFEGYNGEHWMSLTMGPTGDFTDGMSPGKVTEYSSATGSDGAVGNRYGTSVAISGSTSIIGSPGNNSTQGAAYVLTFNGKIWEEQQKLAASDGQSGRRFGSGVALNNNLAIISSNANSGDNPGSVYIFSNNGSGVFTEEQKITASDGQNSDGFGSSLALSTNYVVVGAPGLEAVYIFTFNGSSWVEQQKLTASDGQGGDFFGGSVDIDGDQIVVGAELDDNAGVTYQGSIYVFTFNGSSWVEQQKLFNQSLPAETGFGSSVSIDGDYLVAAAESGNFGSTVDQGIVYVYSNNAGTWEYETILIASDGGTGGSFGSSLTLEGRYLLIGAENENQREDCGPTIQDTGAAYVFKRFGGGIWEEVSKISDPNGDQDDNLGVSVGLNPDNGRFVVGANLADPNFNSSRGKAIFGKIK